MIYIDPEQVESWKNLLNLSINDRKNWIQTKLPIILRTLERAINTGVDYQKNAPWNIIGFICLDSGLYKEAEHVYDEIFRRVHGRELISGQILYFRGISRFFQGKFKGSYEDFLHAKKFFSNYNHKFESLDKAILYMEETIFPMIDRISKTKQKLKLDLNISRFIDKSIGPNILKTIHKWNSSSPLFSSGISQGGGYLLTLKNHLGNTKSIAIDPGYDFIDIFRDLDLSIIDLDAIIVTHDHDDHTESLEAIFSLLAKYNDNVPAQKIHHIDVFGSAGVMLKYQGLFNALDPLGNKEINFRLLTPGSTIETIDHISLKEKYGCVLHVKQAFHQELWTRQESAVGVVIETFEKDKNGQNIKVGITGDTRYENGLGREYFGCQILLLNIGSLEKEEGKFLPQHLGLIGSINIIKEAKPTLAILTEFGEEFRGKRVIVSSVIEEWAKPLISSFDENFRVIPSDIYLEVRITDLNIKETSSKVFLPSKMIIADESQTDSIIYSMNEKTRLK